MIDVSRLAHAPARERSEDASNRVAKIITAFPLAKSVSVGEKERMTDAAPAANADHPLTAYRKRHDMSGHDLARRLDVKASTVWKWERGVVPAAPLMQKLIELTEGEVTANDFFVLPRKKRRAV
jgi:DNA-binding transcriptional regulator YiaG